jgi:O-antigen ligase
MGFDPIVDRFLRVESDTVRLEFWRDSLAILKDHPLGIGLGNFKHVFPIYFASGVSDLSVSHLHNDYLQILIEAGWPAFVALMSGFIFFMGKSIRKVKRMSPRYDPLRFYLAVGALSGIVSMAFHSFFDFNLQIPANCIYFVTLMSMVVVCTRHSQKETKGRRVKSKNEKH